MLEIPVVSIPETWHTLVKELPQDMVGNIQNLPELLDTGGSFSIFHQLPKTGQEGVLNNVLGDGSPLVAAIMHIMVSAMGTP